jgi:hypothetical protein
MHYSGPTNRIKLFTTSWKGVWVQADVLVHVSVEFRIDVVLVFGDVVAKEPTNGRK